MQSKWEQFAQEGAEYYIDTGYNGERQSFFDSGRSFVEQTLQRVSPQLTQTKRALEIGCGVGRLTLPHAQKFKEVIAVDLSPTMLKKLKRNASKQGYYGIKTFLPSDPWDEYAIDYAYSYLVFQHIEDFNVIKRYIKRIASCLRLDRGHAQLQFDTRPSNLLYNIRNVLPDQLLPKNQRRGIRRIRRKPAKLKAVFDNHNLKIVRQYCINTFRHTYLLRKRPDSLR